MLCLVHKGIVYMATHVTYETLVPYTQPVSLSISLSLSPLSLLLHMRTYTRY